MHIIKKIYVALAMAAILLPFGVGAQNSSINSFSPYTIYGIGDITTQGNTYLRSMGGIGTAYRDPYKINYLNPAAMSGMPQRAFILDLGIEGQNYYLKSDHGETSYNSFNISNIAIQFPLAKSLAFGLSVVPFSTVGYRITKQEDDPDIIADLGDVKYKYEGEGGITQLKAGMGWSPNKRLAVGAELLYYTGTIDRSFDVAITSITGAGMGYQYPINSYVTDEVSKVYFNLGAQYNAIMNSKRMLTVGATVQPGGKLNPRVTRMVPAGGIYVDTVSYSSNLENFDMPTTISAGVSYHTLKMSLSADYTNQDWARNNGAGLADPKIIYRNTNSFKIGGEYTPNRIDVRRFMNRITYRAGLRYSDYYMTINGHEIADKAVTFGVGIPLRAAGVTNVNVGVEVGTRGTTKYNLIKENYFKVSVGFNLFGEDYWFIKQKYD